MAECNGVGGVLKGDGSKKTLAPLRGGIDSMAGLVEPKVLLQPPSSPSLPSRLEMHDLFGIADRQDDIPWEVFKDGVEIYRLYGDGARRSDCRAASLSEGGESAVARARRLRAHHRARGNAARSKRAATEAGTLIINPPGTRHSVVGEAGCIVLAIYEKPVRFFADADAGSPPGSGVEIDALSRCDLTPPFYESPSGRVLCGTASPRLAASR